MTDTAEERDNFHDLALAYGFFNPRQLIRLRNSYRLFKLLEAQVAHANQRLSHEQMMQMIFWQDFLQSWPREVREALAKSLLDEQPLPDTMAPQAREIVQRVAESLQHTLGADSAAWQHSYERSAAFASLLVLPRGD